MTSPHPHSDPSQPLIIRPPLNSNTHSLPNLPAPTSQSRLSIQIPRSKRPPPSSQPYQTPPPLQPSAQCSHSAPFHHAIHTPWQAPDDTLAQMPFCNYPPHAKGLYIASHISYQPSQLHIPQTASLHNTHVLPAAPTQMNLNVSNHTHLCNLNPSTVQHDLQPHGLRHIADPSCHVDAGRLEGANQAEAGGGADWAVRNFSLLRYIATEDTPMTRRRSRLRPLVNGGETHLGVHALGGRQGAGRASDYADSCLDGHANSSYTERDGYVEGLNGFQGGLMGDSRTPSGSQLGDPQVVEQGVDRGNSNAGKISTELLGAEECIRRERGTGISSHRDGNIGHAAEVRVNDRTEVGVGVQGTGNTPVQAPETGGGSRCANDVPHVADPSVGRDTQEIRDVEISGQIRQALHASVNDIQSKSPKARGLDRLCENKGRVLDINVQLGKEWSAEVVNHVGEIAPDVKVVKGEDGLVSKVMDVNARMSGIGANNGGEKVDVEPNIGAPIEGGGTIVPSFVGRSDSADVLGTDNVRGALNGNLLRKGENVGICVTRAGSENEGVKEACSLDRPEETTKDEQDLSKIGSGALGGGISGFKVVDNAKKCRERQRGLTDGHTDDCDSDSFNRTQPERSSASDLSPERGQSQLSSLRSQKPSLNVLSDGTCKIEKLVHCSKRMPPLLQAHARTDEAIEPIKDEYDECTVPLAGVGRDTVRKRETTERKQGNVGNCSGNGNLRRKLVSMFDDDDDFEETRTSGVRPLSSKRNRSEKSRNVNPKKLGGKKVKPSRVTLKSMFDDEDFDDVQPVLKKPRRSERISKTGVKSPVGKRKQRRKESVFGDDKFEKITSRRESLSASGGETDEDFVAFDASKAKVAQARRQVSSKTGKMSARATSESTPRKKQIRDIKLAASPKMKPSGKRKGKVKSTRTIDLTAESPVKRGSVTEEQDDAISPSQGSSQPLDIVVEPIRERKKNKRRFPDYLYRKLTEDDASYIRQAFIKYYRAPPSNVTMHGCYELKHGREMPEVLKKKLWETKLKPWSDKWWELYQKFGEVGREIKRQKVKKDIKPALNMRELTSAAKKFYEEHGDARPPEESGHDGIINMLSLD